MIFVFTNSSYYFKLFEMFAYFELLVSSTMKWSPLAIFNSASVFVSSSFPNLIGTESVPTIRSHLLITTSHGTYRNNVHAMYANYTEKCER